MIHSRTPVTPANIAHNTSVNEPGQAACLLYDALGNDGLEMLSADIDRFVETGFKTHRVIRALKIVETSEAA